MIFFNFRFVLVSVALFFVPRLVDAQNHDAEILDVRQLKSGYELKNGPIQLSGLAKHGDHFLIIHDRSRSVFPIKQSTVAKGESQPGWNVSKPLKLRFNTSPFLEGIACKGDHLFAVNEEDVAIYLFQFIDGRWERKNKEQYRELSKKAEKEIDDLNVNGDGNSKLEGIAFDSKNQVLYLAKERQHRAIFKVQLSEELEPGKLERKPLKWPRLEIKGVPPSISDIYFENGFLYVLERRDRIVSKVDPQSMKVVSKVDFGNIKDGRHFLYKKGSKFGLAEALVMTPERIFVGFDNGGKDNIVDKDNRWVKKFKLSGNEPIILELERPKGF